MGRWNSDKWDFKTKNKKNVHSNFKLSNKNYIYYSMSKSQHRHLSTYIKVSNGSVRVLNQNPGWVSGFMSFFQDRYPSWMKVDAEGSFRISVKQSNNKWVVSAIMQLNLHSKDLPILESIRILQWSRLYR
jgi:hypothetical protein